jgi:hypothetical protein
MKAIIQPIADIDRRAKEILTRELGIVNTLRFLAQFQVGSGDYTTERKNWLNGLSLETIVSQIKSKRVKRRRSKR